MPMYRFKAHTDRGRTIKGKMQARSEMELEKELKKIGLTRSDSSEWKPYRGPSLGDVIAWPFQLLEAFFGWIFRAPRDDYDPAKFQRTRRARADIRQRIAKGNSNKMPTFAYLATTQKGNRIYGEMEAKDAADLAARLELLELKLVRASQERAQTAPIARIVKYRVPLREQLILSEQLEIYFRLDMVMTEVLDAVRVGCDSKELKNTLLCVRNHVAQGDTLYQALCRLPENTFDRFFLSIIEVGEVSGRFSGVLMYANRYLKWLDSFERYVASALRSQLISVGIIGLLAAGSIAWMQGVGALVMPVCALIVLWAFCRLPWFKEIRSALCYALPWLGDVLRRRDMLNFASLFSIMWSAGLTAEDAVKRAKHVVVSPPLREGLAVAENMIHNGMPPSEALAHTELLEPMVVMAFRQGETTGDFEAALDGVYYFYVRSLEGAMDTLLTAARTALYALCVGLIAVLLSLYGRSVPGIVGRL
jgi:type II secretory pathway component PulF